LILRSPLFYVPLSVPLFGLTTVEEETENPRIEKSVLKIKPWLSFDAGFLVSEDLW